MKVIKMYCPVCKKEFFQEHYEGGYIDHMNMVNNFDISLERGIKDIVDEIVCHGNDYRELEDIGNRLKCFLIWLKKKKVSEELIKEVKAQVNKKKIYIKKLIQIRNKIQSEINSLEDYSARVFIRDNLFI